MSDRQLRFISVALNVKPMPRRYLLIIIIVIFPRDLSRGNPLQRDNQRAMCTEVETEMKRSIFQMLKTRGGKKQLHIFSASAVSTHMSALGSILSFWSIIKQIITVFIGAREGRSRFVESVWIFCFIKTFSFKAI